MCAVIVLWCIVLIEAVGTEAGGKGPVLGSYLYAVSVWTSV